MASPHFSASEVKRGSGHSSVASAAYNARADLTDLRTGETHDFTRHRSKCLFEGIYAPKDAPEWAQDRAQLWNHVEAFEKHRRAILAQDITIALPHELTLEQNRRLLQDWVRENVTRKGLIADVAIHEPDRRGDARNVHAHVMIVTRKLDGSEFTRSKDRFDTYTEKDAARKADLLAMRGSWEKLANRHLERYGHEARIDMGRKQDGEPTLHMGRHATAQERRGEATELGDRNRGIEAENKRRQEAANENEPSAAELRQRQQAGFRQQDEDRANATWDAADGSTLSNMRQREREARASRSTEDGARRALDDLARVDPHGTARAFGHHMGDRLKSPEDMRREMAERMRGFAVEDPQPEPVRDRARPEPARGNEPSQAWTAQAGGWDVLSREHKLAASEAHDAWLKRRNPQDTRPSFTVREYVEYVQERQARKQDRTPAAEHQVKAPDPVDERRAWAARLRGMAQDAPQEARGGVEAERRGLASENQEGARRDPQASKDGRSADDRREARLFNKAVLAFARQQKRLAELGSRLDRAFGAIRERFMVREQAVPQQNRLRQQEAEIEYTAKQDQGIIKNNKRHDISSEKPNRDFAEDLLREARAELARQAAAEKGQARYREQAKAQKQTRNREADRDRELLRRELTRQDRQARRPHEPS